MARLRTPHGDGRRPAVATSDVRLANATPAPRRCRDQEGLDVYEACGEAASNCSIGSQTKAVWATDRPAIWIVCSATDLPPNRW
jgi:hypothetical protein